VAEVYRFGACELDATNARLTRCGQLVRVRPLPLDVLVTLARSARLVTTGELLDLHWPQSAGAEATLHATVNAARRAIGQLPGQPGPLESVHGRGYQLIGVARTESTVSAARRARWRAYAERAASSGMDPRHCLEVADALLAGEVSRYGEP